MAGSSRDVELVIRARDEAAKAISSVSDALKILSGVQDDVGASAEKTDGLLGELTSALSGLQKEAEGLKALGTVAKQIDRASDAVQRLENISTAAGANLDRMRTKMAEVGAAGQQLTAELERARGAGENLKQLEKQVSANSAAHQRLTKETLAAEEAFDRSQATVAKAKAELAGMTEAGAQASAVLGDVAVNQEAVATASRRAAEQIEAVNATMKRQATPEAMPQAPAAAAAAAYRQQQAAVMETREAWQQARAEATRLGKQMAATAAPTREMAAAFVLSKATATEAEGAYHGAAASLNALKGVAQGSYGAFERMAGGVDSVAATGGRLRETADAAKTLGQSLRELATSFMQIPPAAAEAGEAARGATSLIGEMRGAMEALFAFSAPFVALGALHEVVSTIAQVQTAQTRLAVTFGGDNQRAAEEIDYLRGEAERLGFSFNQLAEQYSRVSIAAKEMGFSAAGTRQIFTTIAEAIRVNGGTEEEAEGIFQGLIHSIDRGTLSARNFNNQIGMRIPGAMHAMADALGVTVQQFDQMQRAEGGVAANEDTLLRFAKNLSAEFGAELPQSLETINAQLGRLTAFLQESEAEIGNAGFAKALTELLDDLTNKLNTAGGGLFDEIGHDLTTLTGVVKFAVDNFGLLAKAVEGFIALKVTSYLLSLAAANGGLSKSLELATADVARLSGAMAGMNMERAVGLWTSFRAQVLASGSALATMGADGVIAAAGTAAVEAAMISLRGIMIGVAATARALWTALGGFPGLLITGATFILSDLLGKWISGVNDANSAVQTHEELLQSVIDNYHKASEAADDFAKKALQASITQLTVDDQQQRDLLEKTRRTSVAAPNGTSEGTDASAASVGAFGGTTASQQRLSRLIESFHQGKLAAADFKAQLEALAQSDPTIDKTVIAQLQDVADKAAAAEVGLHKTQAALRLAAGSATDADKALLGLKDTVEGLTRAFDPAHVEGFTDALQRLSKLSESGKLSQATQDALRDAKNTLTSGLGSLGLSDPQVQAVAANGVGALPKGSNPAQVKDAQSLLDAYKQGVASTLAQEQAKQDKGAAAMTGASFDGLIARIFKNEGTARNPKSTAEGFGQFTNGTWLGLFDQTFPEDVGLSDQAKLAMRKVKAAADKMERTLLEHIAGDLARAGLPITNTNLYLGHFLGGAGGVNMLQALQRNPGGSAAAVAGAADANANPSLFFHRGANGRPDHKSPVSVSELVAEIAKMAGAIGGVDQELTANGKSKQQEFNEQLAELIQSMKDATAAIDKSPRDTFIQQRVEEAQRNADSANRANPGSVVFGSDQRRQLNTVAGGEWDAEEAKREKGIVADMAAQLAQELHKELKPTRDQYIQTEAAKQKIPDLTTPEGKQFAAAAGQQYDYQSGTDAYNDVIGLSSQRKDLAQQLQAAFKSGDKDQVADLAKQIAAITLQIKAALPQAEAFAKAMGDQKMVANLDEVQTGLTKVKTELVTAAQVNQDLASGFGDAFKQADDALGKFIEGGATLKQTFRSIGDAFRNFAADFLEKIAQMIVQQEMMNLLQASPIGNTVAGGVNGLFNAGASAMKAGAGSADAVALSAAGTTLTGAGTTLATAAAQLITAASALASSAGGGGGGGILSALLNSGGGGVGADAADDTSMVAMAHAGGIVGSAGGMTRSVWPGIFAGARRMHTGGIAGLNPGEVPTILKKNEEVLTESDARHAFNQGSGAAAAGAPTVHTKIVNAFDYSTVLSEALNTTPGQKAIINFVRQNGRAIQNALPGG